MRESKRGVRYILPAAHAEALDLVQRGAIVGGESLRRSAHILDHIVADPNRHALAVFTCLR
jgi:hypothetical protein